MSYRPDPNDDRQGDDPRFYRRGPPDDPGARYRERKRAFHAQFDVPKPTMQARVIWWVVAGGLALLAAGAAMAWRG